MMVGQNMTKQATFSVSNFSSDVGRKKFGFSHEDIDDGSAFYEGQFRMFLRNGQGTLQNNETGAKYVGQFRNDKFHGHGDQTWSDGSRYAGEWTSGRKHGEGTYVSAENLKYVGSWIDGRRHGKGVQEYANGDKYDGWWYNGQCSGLGNYYFADGSQYQGAWSQGRYDGAGIMYFANGDRERLTYSHGLLVKREVLPPGPVPKTANRARPTVYGQILESQEREEMMKPTLLADSYPSPFLIKRETETMELRAPPIRTPRATSKHAEEAEKQIGDLFEQRSVDTLAAGDTFLAEDSSLMEFTTFTGGASLDEGGTFFTSSEGR